MAGFKRFYKGEVVGETYVPLTQMDFQADLARIAEAKPDAVFAFLPGGIGVNLVKQFRQAGLADKVKFLSAFTVDESTLPAQQDAALGFFGGGNWAPNMDNPQSKAFVAAYEKEYGAIPATYAFQAYDAVKLLDSALNRPRAILPTKTRCAQRWRRRTSSPYGVTSNSTPITIRCRISTWSRSQSGRTEIRDRDHAEGVQRLRRSVRGRVRDE